MALRERALALFKLTRKTRIVEEIKREKPAIVRCQRRF
jgi:hypothetical protein